METLTVKHLLEAGVHFGHQTKRWNPKMKDYVYGKKNGIYIIDLGKTIRQIADACNFLQHIVSEGGKIIFVGTKRQAQEVVKAAAEKSKMFHVTERWLGGTLTNNATIQKSISKMKELDRIVADAENSTLKKKEIISIARNSQRLHRTLDGIAEMKGLPKALVVVDICHDDIAVKEANKLGIPIVAILDTNANPDLVSHPIVANDDAVRSIKVIMDVIAEAVACAVELYAKNVAEGKIVEEVEKKEEVKSDKRPPRRRDGDRKRGGPRRSGDKPPRKQATGASSKSAEAPPKAGDTDADKPAKEGEAAAPAPKKKSGGPRIKKAGEEKKDAGDKEPAKEQPAAPEQK